MLCQICVRILIARDAVRPRSGVPTWRGQRSVAGIVTYFAFGCSAPYAASKRENASDYYDGKLHGMPPLVATIVVDKRVMAAADKSGCNKRMQLPTLNAELQRSTFPANTSPDLACFRHVRVKVLFSRPRFDLSALFR